MRCKHQRVRSAGYTKYLYCSSQRKTIQHSDCANCPFREYKKVAKLKPRSSKIARLEQKRYSVFTDNLTQCINHPGKRKDDLHEIFSGLAYRKKSMLHGYVLPLCRECHRMYHDNPHTAYKWRVKAQLHYERTHTREEFIQEFGRNYI